MTTKLTLKVDEKVIAKAKIYAKKKNTSLSKLVESYLQFLVSKAPAAPDDVTPLVKSLSGVLNATELRDYEESYKRHITKKYGK
ncbi:MAG TPA: DUF6364 family protein [Saprospiraceae bacterium]|nr:DUF6364 family protein [Saprospiraceae bacterium]